MFVSFWREYTAFLKHQNFQVLLIKKKKKNQILLYNKKNKLN